MINSHTYLTLKMFHLLGVCLFLGNIIVTAFWKVFADLSKDWKIIAFSQRLVTYTDLIFTTTGVILITITGPLMARNFGHFLEIKWIAWGMGLFVASGIIWITILIPIQIILARLARQFKNEIQIPEKYWIYEKLWMGFGMVATVLPLMNLYWMVFKPV